MRARLLAHCCRAADPRLLSFELMPGQKIVTPLWLYECTVSQRLLPTENEKVTSCDPQCQCFRSRCPYSQKDWRMARSFALYGSCSPQSTSSEMTLCSHVGQVPISESCGISGNCAVYTNLVLLAVVATPD